MSWRRLSQLCETEQCLTVLRECDSTGRGCLSADPSLSGSSGHNKWLATHHSRNEISFTSLSSPSWGHQSSQLHALQHSARTAIELDCLRHLRMLRLADQLC